MHGAVLCLHFPSESGQRFVFTCRRVLGIFLLSAVSPPSYVRSSRSAGATSASTVAMRLHAPLQVTAGDHLLPRGEVIEVALSSGRHAVHRLTCVHSALTALPAAGLVDDATC